MRIHTDPAANSAAKALGARAFTSGQDIYFAAGQYNPTSQWGEGLLAHELAHALQPNNANGRPTVELAVDIPTQITRESARAEFYGRGFNYLIRNDIQWHVPFVFWNNFDLVVTPPSHLQFLLSAQAIAEESVLVLASAIEVPFTQDGRQALVAHIAETIDSYGLAGSSAFRLSVDWSNLRTKFDSQAFDAYIQGLRAALGWQAYGALIASGDFATAAGKPTVPRQTVPPAQAGWADQRAREINRMITDERSRRGTQTDLPDRVVAWRSDRDSSWYLNVWVAFGSHGGEAVAHAIMLSPDEPLEQLFARVRSATSAALLRREDEKLGERALGAPSWAVELHRALEKRLASLRQAEPAATDLPDGSSLAGDPDWHVRIWVQRGVGEAGDKIERNYGVVPLASGTSVDEIVPYVRRAVAVLRQYEQDPQALTRPPAGVEITLLDPTGLALAAFPARIEPADLRADRITVTGARNEFRMVLNFESVYGGGPQADLFIASKLYQQYIHFFWEVRRVPTGVPPPEGQAVVPTQWGRYWQWLYDTFNPLGEEQSESSQPRRPEPGDVVYKTDGADLSSRVEFPQEPGDYLIRCVTGHAPIGEHKLKRRSSEAYYPVRVEPIRQVVEAAATAPSNAIAVAQTELDTITKLLAGTELDPNQRQLLLARSEFRTAYLERSRRRETLGLVEGTTAELEFAAKTLAQLQQLKLILPQVVATAKAKAVPPSTLLADHDLSTLYWFIIGENKTVDGYEQELTKEIEYLTGLKGRAREFSSEMKTGSRYQYSPTAAFVSEVTGHVYPLVFMLGEASDRLGRAAASGRSGVLPTAAYSLVDVTSAQTQKVYYGFSWKPGREGHVEAIDQAFERFGDDATYGEGLIAVRIPPGIAGTHDPNHPGTATRLYRSKEGTLQKVMWALGILAAVAGVLALGLTGIGAPAAAAVLGAIAGVAGAITSIHNIEQRSRRHRLEWDAELAIDIIGIVSVIPAVAGARVALAARAGTGLQYMTTTARFVQVYGWVETGAIVVLVPTKLAQDINRIQQDKTLTPEQKARLIEEAKRGALQSGLMLIGSAVGAQMGGTARSGPRSIEDDAATLSRQIELLELEGFGEYHSLQDRGLLDAHNNWTDKASEAVRPVPARPPVPPEGTSPIAPRGAPEVEPTQKSPEGGLHPNREETRHEKGEPAPRTDQPEITPVPPQPEPPGPLAALQQKIEALQAERKVLYERLRALRLAQEPEMKRLNQELQKKKIELDALERKAAIARDPATKVAADEAAAKAQDEFDAIDDQRTDLSNNEAEILDKINDVAREIEKARFPLTRDPDDLAVSGVTADPPLPLQGRDVGGTPNQTAQLQADLADLIAKGATDIRVNQRQVDITNKLQGVNRPDLQYTLNGRRYYIEYEQPSNPRGYDHAQRLIRNDPTAEVTVKLVPTDPAFVPNKGVKELVYTLDTIVGP